MMSKMAVPLKPDGQSDAKCTRATAPPRRSGSTKRCWWLGGSAWVSVSLAAGVLVGVCLHAPRPGDGDAPISGAPDHSPRGLLASKVRGLAQQAPSAAASNEGADPAQPEDTVGTIYSSLAMLYQTRGELDQAASMYEKAIAISTAWAHRKAAAKDYNNLGAVYWSRGDLKQAEAVFLHSLALHETLGDQAGMADNCANLGSVYWAQRDWMKAEVWYWQALRLNKAIDRKGKLTNNYQHLGLLYQAQGEFEKAEAMYVRALRLYQRLGNEAQASTTERLIGAERKAR